MLWTSFSYIIIYGGNFHCWILGFCLLEDMILQIYFESYNLHVFIHSLFIFILAKMFSGFLIWHMDYLEYVNIEILVHLPMILLIPNGYLTFLMIMPEVVLAPFPGHTTCTLEKQNQIKTCRLVVLGHLSIVFTVQVLIPILRIGSQWGREEKRVYWR